MKYQQPKPTKESTGRNGYPSKDVKTSGMAQRGKGCAQRGFTSRGPMA